MQSFDEPLTLAHFKAEGDVEFKTVLFIPTTAPYDYYEKYHDKDAHKTLKLYVRRVFISDQIDDLLPK